MDRDQDQEWDQDRMWAATRLTEAAVTQLFQGASTPVDVNRGQQIGQIVAELYSTIYTGKDVQSTPDARPSLAKRVANTPARSPILPRPTRGGRSGPTPRPIAGSAAPAVGKDAVGPNLPLSIQIGSAQEAPGQRAKLVPAEVEDGTATPEDIPGMGPSLGTQPEKSPDSLQSLLSEIGTDAPQEEAPEEQRLPPPEPQLYPGKPQAASLESQLASIAAQGPMEPEISPTPSNSQPNSTIPRAPSPAPINSGVVVLEASEKRPSKWQFWKR